MKLNKFTYLRVRLGYSLLLMVILMFGSFGYTHTVQAASCSGSAVNPANSTTISINNSSYVGNELPVGSVIYELYIGTAATGGEVICSQSGIRYGNYYIATNSPLGPSFNLNGMIVFPTNVNGVGVTMSRRNGSIVLAYISDVTPAMSSSVYSDSGHASSSEFIIQLIKTGTIDSGSIVDASLFPSVKSYYDTVPGVPLDGFPITSWTANFMGSVSFISQTCTTPNVNVDMGTYSVSQSFNQPGATTPWVDSSIILKECPTFSGHHNSENSQRARGLGSAIATGTNTAATLLTVSLTPASNIIDIANGVIEVDAAGSSGAAATGVGLQLGYTPNNINATATIPSTIWIPGMSWDVQPPNDGTSSFKIPLAARYFQTSNTVTPGPANARVTFNIDYK